RPLNAGFAIVALGIGIGANVGMFSVVNALLLRPLPFRQADRLVGLYIFRTPDDSANQFHQWRSHSAYLEDAALLESGDGNLDGPRDAVRIHYARTSANFFSLLGIQTAAGRTFAAGEDSPGRNNVAVISFGLWQEFFGGDPKALGSQLRVDGQPLTVIGIAPAGFDYPQGA